jgi:hemerythrin-like domain-containing protein
METNEHAVAVANAAGPADLLAEHHRALDEQLDRLVAQAQSLDAADLRAEWTAFERELLRHLEQEEAEILPGFARYDAAEALAILAEHAEIRRALLDLGMSLDLHCLRAETVGDFAQRLKAHAHREDGALYAWASSHVEPSTWQSIKRSLKTVARAGRRVSRLGERIM